MFNPSIQSARHIKQIGGERNGLEPPPCLRFSELTRYTYIELILKVGSCGQIVWLDVPFSMHWTDVSDRGNSFNHQVVDIPLAKSDLSTFLGVSIANALVFWDNFSISLT